MNKNNYVVVKYKGKFSVLDIKTNVYYFIGESKKYCEDRCKKLNELE